MNKMNIFGKILMGVMFVGGLAACDPFLNKEPMSQISPEGYFSDESQLQASLLREYANILPGNGTYSYGFLGRDNGTDNQVSKSISNRYVDNLWRVPSTDGNWSFTNLYYVNYFLQQVLPKYEAGEITGTDARIKHCIGEAYFLRAYFYYSRMMSYGDFPIIREPLPDDMEVLVEASRRSPQNEVARFILEDLDEAIRLMGDTQFETTRINKDAALLLKSRVALFEGTWLKYFAGTAFVPGGTGWPGGSYTYASGSVEQESKWFLQQAAEAAKLVGDKYVGKLAANTGVMQQAVNEPANPYYDMFASESLANVPEVLMWREYSSAYSTHAVPQAAGRGNYMVGMTRAYVQNFLMADGTPVYAHGTYADGDGYYMGDKTLADVKKNRDTRLSVFLKAPGEKNVLYNIGNPKGTEVKEVEDVPYITLGDGERGYSTGYSLHKGGALDVLHYSNNGGYTGMVIFRATEALLNYLEASYELNGNIDATAASYWRALRERAKVDPDYQKTIDATDMAKEAEFDWAAYSAGQVLADKTLYNIRRERRCELLSEGFRYDDLRRWRAMDQMAQGGERYGYQVEGFHLWNTPMEAWYDDLLADRTNNNSNVSEKSLSEYLRPFQTFETKNGFDGIHWHMAHYLNPVPVSEILLTSPDGESASESVIWQNPYWPLEADQPATK
ncbi:MAG: RagB/SusD family nutrient uptake outer membrane protein [Bacteroidales bacterium]|nr:RagB/SusD family nutrient uptake outer membrane protein [Bacteroidales bacterium]